MFSIVDDLTRLIAQGKSPTRYVFAILPPRDLVPKIIRLAQEHWVSGRRVLPEHLHLTLSLSPDFSDRQPWLVSGYFDAMNGLALPACSVRLDQLCGGHGWAGLRSEAPLIDVAALRDTVAGRLRRRGLPTRPGRDFAPHVTLARKSSFTGKRRVSEVSWPASELVLIESSIGQTRHRVIGRWMLGALPRREQFQLALAG